MAVLDLILSVRQQAVAVLGLATVRAFVREQPYCHERHVPLAAGYTLYPLLCSEKVYPQVSRVLGSWRETLPWVKVHLVQIWGGPR